MSQQHDSHYMFSLSFILNVKWLLINTKTGQWARGVFGWQPHCIWTLELGTIELKWRITFIPTPITVDYLDILTNLSCKDVMLMLIYEWRREQPTSCKIHLFGHEQKKMVCWFMVQVPRKSSKLWSQFDIVAKSWYYNFNILLPIDLYGEREICKLVDTFFWNHDFIP